MKPRIFLILPMVGALAACAADTGSFPSLAPRPIESRSDEIVPAPPASVAPADPALAKRTADLLAQARAGDAAFDALLPRADEAARTARGAEIGDEAWVTAQQLLSALEGARAPTMRALGELDSLLVERLSASPAPEDLAAAQAEAAKIAGEQQSGIDSIQAMLSR